jgi:hypothetical protein
MDFMKRGAIQKGAIVETFQNRPFFLRTDMGVLFSPYLCITIDDYPHVQVTHHKDKDGMDYTFVQLPSNRVSDLQPITEKLVAMLDRKPKMVTLADMPHPYMLYIANFIKFIHPKSGNVDASGKVITNGEIEQEGNRIVDYLGKYAPHFYHWMGYSLHLGTESVEWGFPNWLYRHECIGTTQLHQLVARNPVYRKAMQGNLFEVAKSNGKDVALFQDCFLNIGKGDENGFVPRGGKRKRKSKRLFPQKRKFRTTLYVR